jgi:pteridine reductase
VSAAPRPIVLITGAARRVGRAAAIALAHAGCDILITFRESKSEADATINDCIAAGASSSVSRAVPLDLDDLDAVHRFAPTLGPTLGRLDVLVLNASTYTRTPLESLTSDQLMSAFRVNAAAGALLAAGFAPLLQRSTLPARGAIVAMADIHALGEHGLPRSRDFLAYSMSKAAVMELVRTLARELAPKVRVNAVAPGVVAWPESGHESDTAAQQAYLSKVPLARAGTPEDAAAVIKWLALDATYITGEVIRLDGGRNMV